MPVCLISKREHDTDAGCRHRRHIMATKIKNHAAPCWYPCTLCTSRPHALKVAVCLIRHDLKKALCPAGIAGFVQKWVRWQMTYRLQGSQMHNDTSGATREAFTSAGKLAACLSQS
jgi:hypothetical protein